MILVLLASSMFLNYLDRGSLGVAAPVLAQELGISPSRMGLLFSGFFWTYALAQLATGWLVDRYPVKYSYAAGFALWSAATLATGLVGGFAALFACRLLLGLGESVAYPACSRIVSRGVPEERRAVANAWIDVATKAGPAVSTLAGGYLVAAYGWRPLFLVAGAVSLLWLPFWFAWYRESIPVGTAAVGPSVPYRRIIARREAWGISLAMFALGYVWYFLLSWLPAYLVKARGFDLKQTAVLGSAPLAAMALSTMAAAMLSDRWIARGASVTKVRGGMLTAGLLGTAALLPAAALTADASWSVVLLIAAHVTLGWFASNSWACAQTLAGPAAAGRWTGLQNAVGNMGGVASPWLTGIAVEQTGSYVPAFVAAAVVAVFGAAALWLLTPRIEPLRW